MDAYGCLWMLMDAYGCLWMLIVACQIKVFFAGNIAALTVRLHQVVVSGKSVSHRQASFSLAVWPCSRMQQVSSSLWPDFQEIFGWFLIPIWLRRLVQTRSRFKQWEKARCFSMFFLLLFVFVSPLDSFGWDFPQFLLVRHRLRTHEGLARFRWWGQQGGVGPG